MDGIDKAGGASDLARLRPSSSVSSSTPITATTAVKADEKTDVKTPNQGADLIKLLADAAPVDMKKVEAIQSLIQAGAYPIDPRAIAAKMVALDFPSSKH